MATTTTAPVNPKSTQPANPAEKASIFSSIGRLSDWLERNDYQGYDTFDGLNARYLRPLTFETKLLRTILQQGIRRFPINLRPLAGVAKSRSTKGMGFLARGFMRLHQVIGDKKGGGEAGGGGGWWVECRSRG
jgi:hypothetical protein